MTGIGAAASTSIGGYLTDHFGSSAAFLGLGAVAVVALAAVLVFMPETQPNEG
jgi:predicted MFS family arabinose efflux permease